MTCLNIISIIYIIAAIIPGLLIFIVGCLVECLRKYYKDFIGTPTESSIIIIANSIIKGKSTISLSFTMN